MDQAWTNWGLRAACGSSRVNVRLATLQQGILGPFRPRSYSSVLTRNGVMVHIYDSWRNHGNFLRLSSLTFPTNNESWKTNTRPSFASGRKIPLSQRKTVNILRCLTPITDFSPVVPNIIWVKEGQMKESSTWNAFKSKGSGRGEGGEGRGRGSSL